VVRVQISVLIYNMIVEVIIANSQD